MSTGATIASSTAAAPRRLRRGVLGSIETRMIHLTS
jgi:hypothetical protein